MKKNPSGTSKVFLTYAILIYALALAGRAATLFYEICCTDVALYSWINAADYLSEILVSGRVTVSIAAAAFAAYYRGAGTWRKYLLHALLAALLDYLLGCVLHQPITVLSVIQQLLQLLMEAAILFLSSMAALGMNRKYRKSETAHSRKKYSLNRANLAALAIPLLLHLIVKGMDILDFVRTYTGITNTEIAHMTGDALRVLMIYGALAILLAEAADMLFRRVGSFPEEPDQAEM